MKNNSMPFFEIAENGADKVLCKSEKNSSVHMKYVNFSSAQKWALDATLYAISSGRSMIEMLGVLAIIGVLSVGAIAGYSKAMMKYKLNQYTQAINTLTNTVLQTKGQLDITPGKSAFFNELFHKMNALPDGINYIDSRQLEDRWFKTSVSINYSGNKWTNPDGSTGQNDFGHITISLLNLKDTARDVCQSIVIAAKENSANLWMAQFAQTIGGKYVFSGNTYGDAYCTTSNKCLKDLDISYIDNICKSCEGEACSLRLLWTRE